MKDDRKNMNWITKLLQLKNYLGFTVAGLLFAAIGGKIVLSGAGDGSLIPLVFMLPGVAVCCIWRCKDCEGTESPGISEKTAE